MDKIEKENSRFDSYIQDALERIKGEIAHMGFRLALLHAICSDAFLVIYLFI